MNHIAAMLAFYHTQRELGIPIVLATIVKTAGSTYRKAGARVLVTATGDMIGIISGGCLENDILAHAQQVIESGESRLIDYDTSGEADLQWGFGLGCNGSVQIFLELLTPDRCNAMDCWQKVWADRQPQAIATIFASEHPQIGVGCISVPQTAPPPTFPSPPFIPPIAADRQTMAQAKIPIQTHTYTIDDQSIQVCLEILQPPPHLTIFGAGRDVLPVVQLAQTLGWQTTIIDCRSQATSPDRFPSAEVILARRDILSQQVSLSAQSIVIMMNHNFYDDLAILALALPQHPKYIGILGSRNRTQTLIAELPIPIQHLADQLHTPIGLDIGAETAEEIALAIIAEIQAVLHDRQGLFLKQKAAPIHPAYVGV
jgi:xanthine dehydrogenase accessory factor